MGGMEIGDDVFVGAAVLNLYAKCGKMDEAMRVFDKNKMGRRDLVCWTTVITRLEQNGQAREAEAVHMLYVQEDASQKMSFMECIHFWL